MTAASSRASGATLLKNRAAEPEENPARDALLLDDLRAAIVDGLDRALAQALLHGLEARARETVARHLPDAFAPARPSAQADALMWSKLTTLLRRFSAYRLTADEHATLSQVRAFVQAEMRRRGAEPTEGTCP